MERLSIEKIVNPFLNFQEKKVLKCVRLDSPAGRERSGGGRRIFGTRPKGRTPRTGRSVAHTWHRLYQQRRLKRRVSGGSGEVQARPRTGSGGAGQTEAIIKRDPSSQRRPGRVNQHDSESDARAR